MNDDKNKNTSLDTDTDKADEQLHVDNPFKKDDDRKLTEQDLEDEQTFKEAQTERD